MNALVETAEIRDVPEISDEVTGLLKLKLPEIENADALMADDTITLPPELIESVLHQGLKAVLGSSSKARKTWILLDTAISVATGTKFWKWNTQKGHVLYINFEIPRAFIRSRIKVLCRAKGVDYVHDLDVWTLRGHSAGLWQLLPALLAKIEAGKYALIIIDPIYKALGGRDENSAGDISQLCNELEQIAVKTGAAVLFAAHFSKGNQAGKEAIDRIGGSGVFSRDPDTIITLTKHADSEGAFTVNLILRNLPEQPPFVVEWDFPIMRLRTDLDPARLKQTAGRRREHDPRHLLAAIADTTSENPISISAWAAAVKTPRQTLTDYLPEMRSKRLIQTVGEGSSARQHITNEGKAFLNGGERDGN